MILTNKKPAIVDSPEEHRITLPGLDIAFNHTLKIVFVVDQSGAADDFALSELGQWCTAQGYFLHGVVVAPAPATKDET